MGDDDKKVVTVHSIDTSSPYYLGSGDQLGNLITHVILTGDNYVSWVRAMTLSLKARRKYVFIAGTLTKPNDEKKLLDWETVNSMLVSWILRSIDSKLVASIPYHEEARKLWQYLEKRFCVVNGPCLQQLRAAIIDCKQAKDQTMEDYYSKLMGIYDELSRLKPLHGCDCGKCTRDVVGKYAKDRDEEILHQFLIGVNYDKYGGVRSNLLSQQTLPNLDRAYQAFVQKERVQRMAKGKAMNVSEVGIFAAQMGRRSNSRYDKSKLQKTGHDEASCFKLHGIADWWYEKYKGGKSGRASASNQRPGHVVGDRGKGEGTHEDNTGGTGGGTPLANLTSEHVQYIMNLINEQKLERIMGKHSLVPWLFNTDISNHVSGCHDGLYAWCAVSCPVSLLDGTKVEATKEGNVMLLVGLVLTNVLFVPTLQ